MSKACTPKTVFDNAIRQACEVAMDGGDHPYAVKCLEHLELAHMYFKEHCNSSLTYATFYERLANHE